MKYFVNETCIGCGVCEATCPEVFKMNDDGVAVAIEEDVPDEFLDAAEDSMGACPVGAIENAE